LISTTPHSTYSSDSYGYTSPTPTTQHPVTTIQYSSTPIPSLHAGKSISDRKFVPAPIPLATLRVTMDTSSAVSNQDDDQQSESKSSEDSTKATEDSTKLNEEESNHVESITQTDDALEQEENSEKIEETTSVEQRLKKISEEYSINDNTDKSQSFISLSDFLKTLRPTDRKIKPQIDSDYSNTMHVLGETASIVGSDDQRKIKTIDLRQTNRALY